MLGFDGEPDAQVSAVTERISEYKRQTINKQIQLFQREGYLDGWVGKALLISGS